MGDQDPLMIDPRFVRMVEQPVALQGRRLIVALVVPDFMCEPSAEATALSLLTVEDVLVAAEWATEPLPLDRVIPGG